MPNFLKSYYFLLIITIGFLHFIIPTDIPANSAFVWPTADSFHALEREKDANFLNNDFFTNSSFEKSPRTPYIAAINAISQIFFTDYYNVLYTLEWLLAIIFPIGIFLFLGKIKIKNNPSEIFLSTKNSFLALFISLSSCLFILTYFRYAHWRPIPIWPAPQSIALCLSFYAGFLLLSEQKIQKIYGIILLQLATIIHPVNALLFVGFFIILLPNIKSMATYGILLLLSIAPVLVGITLLFGDNYHLSNADFLKLYVVEAPYHSHHYMPNHFDNKVRDIVIALLLVGGIFALFLKNWRLAFIAAMCALSYFIAIKLQIFAFDFPNRYLLIFGPVRFTQFGYFMFALIFAGCLADLCQRIKISDNLKQKFLNFDLKYINIIAALTLLICYSLKLYNIDDPKTDLEKKYHELFRWIQNNSDEKDVFAAPLKEYYDLMIAIPIIEKRPVFYSGAAPFIEKFFAEAIERKELLYGARAEWIGGGPEWFYCNKVDAKRVKEAASKYQLDWVIMANNCPSNEHLKSLKISYKDDNLTVYKVHNKTKN